MKNKLSKLLENCPKIWRTRRVAEHQELIEYLETLYPNVQLTLQIHSFLTDTSPFCIICQKPVKFAGKKTCSYKCREISASNNVTERIFKQKETLLKKYGVDSVSKIPGINERKKTTLLNKYGALQSPKAIESARSRSNSLNVKGKKTLKDRYGVDNPGQLPDHRIKSKATLLKNYGVDNYYASDEFKNKRLDQLNTKIDLLIPSTLTVTNIQIASEDKRYLFPHSNNVISFTCNTCKKSESIPSETFKWRVRETETACKSCANIGSGSKSENEIRLFLQSNGVKTIDNIRMLNRKEIDIFLPELNIGIEYHGLYWHNDLRIPKNYHIEKLKTAEERKIKLIQIFEDEWINQSHIVKSRLLYLVKKQTVRIMARKCTISMVTSEQARQFLTDNHIQGFANSSIKLGLFFNDELVSLMTFSRLSKSKGYVHIQGHWELSRFCNKTNTTVIGGASKLFSYFISCHSPEYVLSFADRRWSDGNLYKQLNFSFTGNTEINYWYFNSKNTERIHRYKLRKNKSDDQSLTEYENRLSQGYLRIWDCGSSRWEWTKK